MHDRCLMRICRSMLGSAGPARNRIELGPDLEESQIIRSAVGDLSEDLPGMAREMPARAMRLGPSPRAVRRPVRCALEVYARYGL